MDYHSSVIGFRVARAASCQEQYWLWSCLSYSVQVREEQPGLITQIENFV